MAITKHDRPTHYSSFAPRRPEFWQSQELCRRFWRIAALQTATAPSPYLNTARSTARLRLALRPNAKDLLYCFELVQIPPFAHLNLGAFFAQPKA